MRVVRYWRCSCEGCQTTILVLLFCINMLLNKPNIYCYGTSSRDVSAFAGAGHAYVPFAPIGPFDHCSATQIVSTGYTVFAPEDSIRIRVRKRRSRTFIRSPNTRSFSEPEQFLRYNAEAPGRQVLLVGACYTLQKRPVRRRPSKGKTGKGRRSGAGNADFNSMPTLMLLGTLSGGVYPV